MTQGFPNCIGIGVLGYDGVARAHIHGYTRIRDVFGPEAPLPRLVSVCGRSQDKLTKAALRYGFEKYTSDWMDLISDDEVKVIDNCAPNNLHSEVCIEAARHGKHILCEKPLGRNAEESKRMLEAVQKAGVKHMVSFNYRFVPAVMLAKELIDAGKLGKIYHFRARYCDDSLVNPETPFAWRMDKELAGSGVVGDLGSHIIDLARFLVGEFKAVSAMATTFIPERPLREEKGKRGKVTTEDAFTATVEFQNGAIGTLEASGFCPGRKNFNTFEINGSKGTIIFDLERLNELEVYLDDSSEPTVNGFRRVMTTDPSHPFCRYWWPTGHIIGWEHTFIHEIYHFLRCIKDGEDVGPIGATFEDGYKCAVICDALLASAESHQKVDIS
ncbi:MAG TPA: Gfo/Idh/MocA family oxidoreductase [Firmicutes bacterium]|nr:Gfo/Idh/MocA family oxidoreductase [Bacillota bacterium]